MADERVQEWLDALDRRSLADLTPAEIARALRALSSCYVERRSRIPEGRALDTRGKRAAFALFYGPLHFFVVRQVIRALGPEATRASFIVDLGCGTGVAGAAWALECGARRIGGIDRRAWAAAEATWTYRTLGLAGRAQQGDVSHTRLRAGPDTGIVAAYVINEMDFAGRTAMRAALLEAHRLAASVLIVEPIARTIAPWWDEWRQAFEHAGGRADEWRFPAHLPERQRALARAAGLEPRELTARTLWLPTIRGRIPGRFEQRSV